MERAAFTGGQSSSPVPWLGGESPRPKSRKSWRLVPYQIGRADVPDTVRPIARATNEENVHERLLDWSWFGGAARPLAHDGCGLQLVFERRWHAVRHVLRRHHGGRRGVHRHRGRRLQLDLAVHQRLHDERRQGRQLVPHRRTRSAAAPSAARTARAPARARTVPASRPRCDAQMACTSGMGMWTAGDSMSCGDCGAAAAAAAAAAPAAVAAAAAAAAPAAAAAAAAATRRPSKARLPQRVRFSRAGAAGAGERDFSRD